MQSFLRNLIRLVFASAALLVLATTPAVASTTVSVPLTGTYTTYHTDTMVDRDGDQVIDGIDVEVEGMGWANIIGLSTCASVYQRLNADGSGEAKYVLRGCGRDTLILTLTAESNQHHWYLEANEPPRVVFGGTFVVTGTGRYRGADGAGTWSGVALMEGSDEDGNMIGTGGWAFWGEITIDRRLVHGCWK